MNSSPQDQTSGPELVAVAHDIGSLHNVGAIFRTADGAGFTRVITSGYTGGPPDKRISKVALDAEQALAHEAIPTVEALIERLDGALVVVLEQSPTSQSLHELQLDVDPGVREIALVACNELYGAPRALLERADVVLELPMRGIKQSLNVSVAFGIAAFAVAHAAQPYSAADLLSRLAPRGVRAGVLTAGRTQGEVPTR